MGCSYQLPMHEKKAVRIRCTAAATLPLDELTGMQGALKTLSPENEGKLRKQILEAGFRAPIFVWKDGKKHRILDGHQRLTVLTKLQKEGYNVPPLPVAYIEADNEKDAYRTVLSFASAYGQMTNDGLLGFMELSGIDFETIETDFRLSEIDLSLLSGNAGKVEEEVFDAEAAAAAIKEPISKRGDLYALGTHRLLCGDATGGGDVDRLMGGEKADMVFTDPPYGMNLDTDYSAIKGGVTTNPLTHPTCSSISATAMKSCCSELTISCRASRTGRREHGSSGISELKRDTTR
jgi:16S rRNA G966 N2-methylase RsmD